ncbi:MULTISPECIES: hypothetical protein [unclassified Paenibacillus]|uniref:hypothetical protein n=1 Tax=unclassified Paenibacillus TaxID=185978 RepID=UPI0003FACDED|nr:MULTISPECIES: hypothetical protein [unclassified Paenibacillus]KGP80088.1 hypothetical protein P364_0122060 [Paenibacillus sp. MAEPY2]KGP89411.1 hypothetical protein P363_0100230 [Paenibacillus sp. MAEPY1]
MAKVFAPNKEYTGLSAGVAFANGVGETDNPHLLSWFESKGYEVEKEPESVNEPGPTPADPKTPNGVTEPTPNDPPEDKSAKGTKAGK